MTDIAFLEWLTKRRSQNQSSSLLLLQIVQKHKTRLQNDVVAGEVASSLAAASFSLWRAVFLAEVEPGMAALIDDAEAFLDYLVRDNTILYFQDKKSKHWTFRFYVQSARDRLQRLGRIESPKLYEASLADQKPTLSAQAWWDLNQGMLDTAIKLLSQALNDGVEFRKISN